MRIRSRSLIANSYLLFPVFYTRRRHWHRLIKPSSDLCIEGFPRSANSFVLNKFRLAYPELKGIAHHVHAAGQILWAVRWNVPTVVLVREPVEAVASLYVGLSGTLSVDSLLRDYSQFYSAVNPVIGRVIVGEFSNVTAQPKRLVLALNNKFNLHLDPNAVERAEDEAVFEHLKVWNSLAGQTRRLAAIPSEDRLAANAAARILCERSKELKHATTIYKRIAGLDA